MSGTLMNLIVQIIAGAIGGNGAGAALKHLNLGTLGNTIAGAIGGGAGGQLLSALIPALAGAAGTTDIGALVGQRTVSSRQVARCGNVSTQNPRAA